MSVVDGWLQESADIFKREQQDEKRREFYELQEQRQRMNKTLNDLVESAIVQGLAKDFKENGSAEMNTPPESFASTFAELIIQECITVIQHNLNNANTVANSKLDVSDDAKLAYGSMVNMADKCIKDIKEHFGIN